MTPPGGRQALKHERGQSFGEWAVAAGILAAVGIAISIPLNAAMRALVRGLATSVRTIAP